METWVASSFIPLRGALLTKIGWKILKKAFPGLGMLCGGIEDDETEEDDETTEEGDEVETRSGEHGNPASWSAIVGSTVATSSTTIATSSTLSDEAKVTRVIGLKKKKKQLRKMLKMRRQQVDGSADKRQLREQLRVSLLADPDWLASTWEQARDARGLSQRNAKTIGIAKLVLWHWSQPLAYMVMLARYRCFLATLNGDRPRYFASIVATREVLYLGSTAFAAWHYPVFLLMDPITVWKEATGWRARIKRAAMWVLIPNIYTAQCLIKRFPSYADVFGVLMILQYIADVMSCFALGSLLATGFESEQNTPMSITIGYAWTAFGFLLFFGPVIIHQYLTFRTAHNWRQCALSHSYGITLLCAWIYIMYSLGRMVAGTNLYCSSDPCNGHGECYGAGQCRCTPGYGPEVSVYDGEPLCATYQMACTLDQVTRAFTDPDPDDLNSDHVCCSKHGKLTATGCDCPNRCPKSPDDPLMPTKVMCSEDEQYDVYHYPCKPYGCPWFCPPFVCTQKTCYEDCVSGGWHC
jgi:hypothetical protein